MQYLWRLFFHFFSSNSRHGTHSPFVYSMADEVIYAKSKRTNIANKQQLLLADVATYFEVDYVSSPLEKGRDKAFVIEDVMMDVEQLTILQQQFRYLVIPDIYRDNGRKLLWESICRDSRFIVCIDLFYYGLVFYRKEQPKELFKLRFPYWR
ncbi:hypothetical protein [Sphingobacterium tabacisoli]|uniref:Uncharacterized protein n=1 Tax=Sphingobacterium tabacisoli TaxID=2044855 RepID=A0ABW5KY29_9SPHI|nr:hypothetical protein [Sphingobacterium tabacisoli]